MVTVFLSLSAMAKLPKGYVGREVFEGVKKPAEAGSSMGTKCLTWPLGQPCWPQGRLPQRVQPLQLALQHPGPLPALLRGLQGLSRRLGQRALLFGSSRCQSPRPAQ